MAVPTRSIVEALDVISHFGDRQRSILVDLFLDSLFFQAAEERLGEGRSLALRSGDRSTVGHFVITELLSRGSRFESFRARQQISLEPPRATAGQAIRARRSKTWSGAKAGRARHPPPLAKRIQRELRRDGA